MLCQDRTIATKTGLDGGPRVPKQVQDQETGYYVTSKQHVASRGAEDIGLSPEQVLAAKSMAAMDGKKNTADKYYRIVRGKPLLMIHVLDLMYESSKDAKPKLLISHVPAISISFPECGSENTVRYVVNKVWLKQQMESLDSPDDEDEDDYDE